MEGSRAVNRSTTEDIIFICILADKYLLDGKGPPAWEKYVEHGICERKRRSSGDGIALSALA